MRIEQHQDHDDHQVSETGHRSGTDRVHSFTNDRSQTSPRNPDKKYEGQKHRHAPDPEQPDIAAFDVDPLTPSFGRRQPGRRAVRRSANGSWRTAPVRRTVGGCLDDPPSSAASLRGLRKSRQPLGDDVARAPRRQEQPAGMPTADNWQNSARDEPERHERDGQSDEPGERAGGDAPRKKQPRRPQSAALVLFGLVRRQARATTRFMIMTSAVLKGDARVEVARSVTGPCEGR